MGLKKPGKYYGKSVLASPVGLLVYVAPTSAT